MRSLAFVPYIAVSVAHLAFIIAGNGPLVSATKPLLMPALLLGLLLAAPRLKSGLVLIAALGIAFSWAGDVLLQSPAEVGFLVGLGAFLIAHLFYITAFVNVGTGRFSYWTAIYLVWYVVLLVLLIPHLGSLVAPVVAYGAVLGATAVLATRVNPVVAWGGALFLVSDTVLAVDRFLPSFALPGTDLIIMTTYLLGEGLIVYGLVVVLRRRHG